MLRHFSGAVGKPPDGISGQDVFARSTDLVIITANWISHEVSKLVSNFDESSAD